MSFFVQIIFIFLIKQTFSSTHSIIQLTDNSFDTKITPHSSKQWFIVFYVDSCSYCEQMLRVLEKEVIPNYDNDNSIEFGSVDCNKNIWLSLRFNITHIPYSVLLDVSHQQMYEFKSYSKAEHIYEFIESDKNENDAIDIPEPYSYVKAIKTVIVELYFSLQETIEDAFKSRGYNVKVSHYVLIPCLILLFGIVVKIQKMILKQMKNLIYKVKGNIKKGNNKRKKE